MQTVRSVAAKINNVLAWLMFIGANLAILFIALNVFGAAGRELHRSAVLIWLMALLALIAALVARTSRLNVGVSALIFFLFFAQPYFAYTNFADPMLHGLHAINGLAILYLSYVLANGRAKAVFIANESRAVPAAASD